MKNNKIFIILINLLSILLIVFILPNTVFGSSLIEIFQKSIALSTSTEAANEVIDVGGKIVGIIQIVGTMVSVGMLIILGIKYVLGSADEKASYRKSMIPYIVGAVLIFGVSNITQVIYEWAKSI